MNRAKNVESSVDGKGHSNSTRTVKLPNLVIIKFNLDPSHRSKFCDLFRTSILLRTDIASPAKFEYLLAQLEGEESNFLPALIKPSMKISKQ